MRSTSTFITVLAWLSIILTGLMSLMTLFQNVMLWTLVRSETGGEGALDAAVLEEQPRILAWVASHLEFWFAFWLVVSFAALVASIGLLRRRDWARRLYVGVLALGVVWTLAGIVALLYFFPVETLGVEGSPLAEQLWTLAMVVMSLATGALFTWLAWRLTRPSIRAEFQRG